jgi:hypothetical protein
LGDYLSNDNYIEDDLFINKKGYRDITVLMPNNSVINLINRVNNIAYKINKDVLNFIELYSIEKGTILKEFRENPLKKKKNLRSLTNSIYAKANILNIAETYLSIDKIYFPIILDQKTRLYCISEYLNY